MFPTWISFCMMSKILSVRPKKPVRLQGSLWKSSTISHRLFLWSPTWNILFFWIFTKMSIILKYNNKFFFTLIQKRFSFFALHEQSIIQPIRNMVSEPVSLFFHKVSFIIFNYLLMYYCHYSTTYYLYSDKATLLFVFLILFVLVGIKSSGREYTNNGEECILYLLVRIS